jgi:hypothetical protein
VDGLVSEAAGELGADIFVGVLASDTSSPKNLPSPPPSRAVTVSAVPPNQLQLKLILKKIKNLYLKKHSFHKIQDKDFFKKKKNFKKKGTFFFKIIKFQFNIFFFFFSKLKTKKNVATRISSLGRYQSRFSQLEKQVHGIQ